MTDIKILTKIVSSYNSHTQTGAVLGVKLSTISNWKSRGIPARWRPTIWALLEERCPDVAIGIDRDGFLNVKAAVTPSDEGQGRKQGYLDSISHARIMPNKGTQRNG